VRIAYQEQIDDILADLARMCRVVSEAVQGSTTALLNADLHTAEQVISGDLELDRLQASIEERAFRLLPDPTASMGLSMMTPY
jgi:phosphate transport system protein